MIAKTLFMVMLGLALAAPATADIYRWTDADGQVHFGENPPMDADAERVDSARPAPAPANTESADDEAETEADADAEAEAADSEQAAGNDEAADDPELAEMCDNVRQNAEVYADESVRRVRRDNGEVEILTPDEREQRLDEAETFLAEHC